MIETQACNGLRLWADNFERLIVTAPLAPGPAPDDWLDAEAIGPAFERIELHPLPTAYRPDQFIRRLNGGRRELRALIARADMLAFSIGGLFGDWGAVGAIEAARMGRRYAVWTDRVESEVARSHMTSGSLKGRVRAWLTWRPMRALERDVIRRSALGLFHGRDCYDAYAPFCSQPELVHNIHIGPDDHISAVDLESKRKRLRDGPLQIVYAGRADAMKGPFDWINVLARLADKRVDFRASWIGDGGETCEMRRRIEAHHLCERVELLGRRPHKEVLDRLRRAHLFMFCHKTAESPRCLIEALISGCPIVGYESPYAADLISRAGGGVLTPRNDIEVLAERVADLAENKGTLEVLMASAAKDGSIFNDAAVFRHRSDLIKQYV